MIGAHNNSLPNFNKKERQLISCMTTLKAAAKQGSYFFFMEMCDAHGEFVDLEPFTEDTAEYLSVDEDDLPGEPCLPWNEDFGVALQGKGMQWAWDGADHALLQFMINVLDEDDWTLEVLNESMTSITNSWFLAKEHIQKTAKENGIDYDDVQTVMDAMSEIAVYGNTEDSTIWAITCVIHKDCKHFNECISWTENKVEEILSILLEVGAIDKIPDKKGDENNE